MIPGSPTTILLATLLAAASLNAATAQDREEPEGGIVGTGIVGTITELGSIYVNGQHIRFDDGQMVASPLGDRPAVSLVPGETIVVEAIRTGDAWQAESLRAYLPIVAPVDSIAARSIGALGADITIPGDAASIDAFVGAHLAAGDWIAVSGFWNGDTVVASRIEKIAPQPLASAVGTYIPAVGSSVGSDRVGAVRLNGVNLEHARPMDLLSVQGVPTGDGLDVESATIGLFSGPVGEVLFEGYLSQPNLQGAYTVQGSGFLAYVENPMPADPARGLFCGEAQGVAAIERVLDLPEAAAQRDDVLRAFSADRASPCGAQARQ